MNNDFNNLPEMDFSPESFGTSAPPRQAMTSQPARRRWWLWACGGCGLLFTLICGCCCALTIFSARQPETAAGVWGFYIQFGGNQGYQFAEAVICPGSQALEYTRALEDQNAQLSEFEYRQRSGEDFVIVTGILEVDGVASNWRAEVYTKDGGQFPLNRCVDRVVVLEGFGAENQ